MVIDVDVPTETPSPKAPEIFQINSADIDQARGLLNRLYYPMAVSSPTGPSDFALQLELIQLGPLAVGYIQVRGALSLLVSHLDGYHITLPTAGRVLTRQAGHEVVASTETAAVFRPGHAVQALHGSFNSELHIKIDSSALEAELAAMLGRDLDGPIDLGPTMDMSDGPCRSWGRMVRLLRDELPHRESLIHQPLIAEQVRHSVLTGLLLSVPHRHHDELRAPARPGAPRAIRRVLDLINAEPERAFSVTELATVAGMSVRSLQEGFRRHVGCTPMTHLQQVRLTRAHEALRQADPAHATVAAIAHRWGFAHLGRFASAYRMRFGESPSVTLRGGF